MTRDDDLSDLDAAVRVVLACSIGAVVAFLVGVTLVVRCFA